MAISATPCADSDDPVEYLGATIPSNLNRELASGAIGANEAVVVADPSKRERSPRTAVEPPTATAYEGDAGAWTNKRSPQNTAVPATRPQITNAENRASMHDYDSTDTQLQTPRSTDLPMTLANITRTIRASDSKARGTGRSSLLRTRLRLPSAGGFT